jgi:FkbM family methyltransferase
MASMKDARILLEAGHQRLAKARHGYVLYNKNDTVIGRSIEVYGEYFESEVNVFRHFVTAGDVVLDIGANIGTHTLALARLVGPQGLVFAFEPQRIVFQTLCANMALNSLDNVHCINAVVGETPARLGLSDPDPHIPNNFGGVQVAMLAGAPQAAPVDCVVLDDFLAIGRLRLIKIDVEGMEAEVLRGASQTLARFKPILYVENDCVDKSPELVSLPKECGYHCYWHLPPYASSHNYFESTEQMFPVGFVDRGDTCLGAVGFAINLLCVPASLGLPVEGLRPATDPDEHPLKREHVHFFSGSGNGAVPVIKG